MKHSQENHQAKLPVSYLDIQDFVLPEGEELEQEIVQLKNQKKATVWVSHFAPKIVQQWADCIVHETENISVEPCTDLLIFYGEKEKAKQLKAQFPKLKVVLWEIHTENTEFPHITDVQRLFLCLKYELPLLDNQ